ncbi:nephrocystin-1 isoform X1 [Oreochromis niloticus]|uniref:nephrocystin-1 isoform X1 n=1 Tax=Oreochromis niloticus TaxID=8128 RepID=UPI000674831A|nr:nephrocystin-1 isoform X1 [Oreochromis niloticus]XP_025753402.1 nephrocystin-1 isoform X1 [Oreochromis niloticus]
MPLKRRGPLQLAQREVDEIKKQVDSLEKDAQSQAGSTEEAFRRCQKLQMSAEETLRTLKKLSKADELAPVGNYDQRKQEEERRVQNILERLKTLSLELSPPGPSTEAGNVSKEDSEDSAEEDDDEDSNDNEEEHVENDNNTGSDERRDLKPPSQSDARIYMVLSDFKGEQEGDLSVRKGEVLRIIRKTADGWWLAQNTKGSRGVVPKTFLKIGSSVDDDDDDDDDSKEDDDEKEESEEEEDQDSEELTDDPDKRSASQSNWCTVKKALSEIDATDVLSAMGAIPSGFRPSTLNKLLVEEGHYAASITYRGSHYIQPQLSQSQLSFKDLFLDPDTGKVRPRQVNTSVCFSLWSCRMIPTPGVGVQVLSRHVRLCAFDGTQVLSNIHVVRATYNAKSPKTWSFSPRVTGILPTVLDGDCFLRCNSTSPDLGILFELGVTFIRNSTGERGDLSCGWAFLKLTDDAGNPLPNRTYELPVNGGTPYEKDVAVEASATRGSPSGVFQQMLQARRQPKLIVKLKSANSRTQTQLSVLPDTLLHCLNCIHLLVLHRHLLADALLMDRPTMQNADLICSPILSTFPVLLDQPDLLDALRSAWLDAETNMNRAQKRDLSYLKLEFVKVYMSSVYFLLHSPSLPCYRWADPLSEEQRARVIYTMLEKNQRNNTGQSGGPDVFVDGAHTHLAFDVTELTFDLLRVAW